MRVAPAVGLRVVEHLAGLVDDAVADRVATLVETLPPGRGLIFETALDADAPLPVDFAVRCADSELRPMLRACGSPAVVDEFLPLNDLGTYRNWLEFDTSVRDPGVPSLFAQYRDPRLAAAALRLLPRAERVPDLPADIRHIGKMYGRDTADVRVVWSGLDLRGIDDTCRDLGLTAPGDAVGDRPGALHLALAFAPALQPRFGVEWMVRRLPAWQVPQTSPAAAELLGRWRTLPREVPGVSKAEVSHLKWAFEGDRITLKAYLYVD